MTHNPECGLDCVSAGAVTRYIVTLREGSMCAAAGLPVEFNGAEAHVLCKPHQTETFWAQRLAFLKANPAHR